MFVTVGTGIGCGVLIGGRLFRGYRNRGMEMGHITVKCDGEACACGGRGCLEHYASTSALVRRFCELSGAGADGADGREVVRLYKEGNPAAVQAMEEHWNYLAHGIASMINLFAPQRVVVGGGISEAGDFYLAKLREGVRRQMMSVCGEDTELVAALGTVRMGGLCLPRAAGRRTLVLAMVRFGARRPGTLVGGQRLHGRCFVPAVRHPDGCRTGAPGRRHAAPQALCPA